MTVKLQDSQHKLSVAGKIQHWLLRKIAGNAVVILNAQIDMVPQDGKSGLRIIGVDNALICNNGIPYDHGLMLQISQTQNPR